MNPSGSEHLPVAGDLTSAYQTNPSADAAPCQLGDYRILREIGRGGMGVVYEAEQVSLGRHVALKVLPTALLDGNRLERFRREARAAAKLHHTNIVPVYGVGEADGAHYYAMQFIAGHGLDQVLSELRRLRALPRSEQAAVTVDEPKAAEAARSLLVDHEQAAPTSAPPPAPPRSGSVTAVAAPGAAAIASATGRGYWERVARLGFQGASALAHAHEQGVLHRDIKPANLLLDPQGTLWITDFGLAKLAEDGDLTRAGDVVGTLRYMAPERFDGRCDARADIYALGLTLYELLTLRPAFDESAREKLVAQVTRGELIRPLHLNPEVPRDLETIVLKACAREPEARYQSAAQLADDLQCFMEDRPIRARRASMWERLGRWRRRNPLVAGLTATLAAVILAVAVGATLAAFSFRDLADKERAAKEKIASDLDRLHQANGLLESGFRHAVRKDWSKARADYGQAIVLRPDNSQVWSDRAMLYLRLGLLDEAADDFAELFKVRPPNEPAWWHIHAALRRHVGDEEGYRAVCRAMRKHFPEAGSPEVVRAVVQTCTLGPGGSDDPQELVRLVEDAETRFPAEKFAAQRLAAWQRAGQDRDVVQLTAPADPKQAAAHRPADLCFRAMSQARLGEAGPGLASLAAAREKLDATASVLSLQTFGPSAAERFVGPYPPAATQEALIDWLVDALLFREAGQNLEAGKGVHPLAWFIRARGCAALELWDKADEAAIKARALCFADDKAPRLGEVAWFESARLNADRGLWRDAAADLERAAVLAPPPYPLAAEAAAMYTAHGRHEDARAQFSQALVKAPGDLGLRLQRAQACARLKDWDQAAADLNAVLTDQRFLPPLQRGIGGGFYTRFFPQAELPAAQGAAGDPRQDVRVEASQHDELYARLCALRPNDAELRQLRGRFLLRSKRWPEAVDFYATLVESAKDQAAREGLLHGIAKDVAPWDDVFKPLAERWPSPTLWSARCEWLLRAGDIDQAAAVLLHVWSVPDDAKAPRGKGPAGKPSVAGKPPFSETFPPLGLPQFGLGGSKSPKFSDRGPSWFDVVLSNEALYQKIAAERPEDAELRLARFHQQANKGAWAAAEQAARDVAELRADHAPTLRSLGERLAIAKEEQAVAYYRQALKLAPGDVELHLILYRISARSKKWDDAAAALDGALRQAGPGKPGPDGKAQLSVKEIYSRIQLDEETLRELTQRRPDDGRLWLRAGTDLGNANKWQEALPHLEKAAELVKDSLDVWLPLIRASCINKKWDQTSQAMDNALKLVAPPGQAGQNAYAVYQALILGPEAVRELGQRRPKDSFLWIQRGRQLNNAKNWKEAIPVLVEAAELAPGNSEVWAELGRAHAAHALAVPPQFHKGEPWKEAGRAFSKALDTQPPVPFLNPKQPFGPVPPSLYGEIVGRSQASPQAKVLFNTVAELRPKDGRLWFELVRSMNMNNVGSNPNPLWRSEYRYALDELVKRSPDEPAAWIERALVRAREGDVPGAAADYIAAAQLFPKNPPMTPVKFKLYKELSDFPKVMDMFLAQRPNDPFPLYQRAYLRAGNPKDPEHSAWETDLDKAIEMAPDYGVFRGARRHIHLELGHWVKAAGFYAEEFKREEPTAGALLWVEAASAYAAAGKVEQYRALCRRMQEAWPTPPTAEQGQQLAWTLGLMPECGGDLNKALDLAQKGREAAPTVSANTSTVALVRARLGQHAQAAAMIKDHLKTTTSLATPDRILLELLAAIALVKDGKENEARPFHQAACKSMDASMAAPRRRLFPGHAWAAAFTLRREADALFSPEVLPPPSAER